MKRPAFRSTLTSVVCSGAAALWLGTGCGVDENLYNAAVKDRDQTRLALNNAEAESGKMKSQYAKEAAEKESKLALLRGKLESMGQDVSRLENERGTLGGELEQTKRRLEEIKKAQEQAEARASQYRSLVKQFKKLTDAGKLQVEVRENRMIVRLGDQILFDPGKTDLKKEGQDALAEVTKVLTEIQNRNFQVAGHTDNAPIKSARFRSNWDLSTARAVEVVNFMMKSGMDPKRLSAAGYADQSPVAANDTPENKAKNRRIEIVLMPNLDDLPPIDDSLKAAGG